jgi:hypothetical protein
VTRRAEIIRLSEGLLQALEGSPLLNSTGTIINKGIRIAELAGNETYSYFFYLEMSGYPPPGGRHDDILRRTRRWDGGDRFTPHPAALLEDEIPRMEAEISRLRITASTAVTHAQVKSFNDRITLLAENLSRNRAILHHVRALSYRFASTTVAEVKFSNQSADIFAQFQRIVDAKIAATAKDAFEKLPSVFERLNAGDQEAISHALSSCRRIIDAFTDAVFPPREEPYVIGEHRLDVTAKQVRNRARAYVASAGFSKSQRERLNKIFNLLYDRICAGVHADVTVAEARALVLNTYVLLGELVERTDTKQADQLEAAIG